MPTLDLDGIESGLNCAKNTIFIQMQEFGFLIHHLKNESHLIIAQNLQMSCTGTFLKIAAYEL